MKKLLSILLCFAMVLGVLLIFPVKAYAYSGGSGTEDDPYLISSADDIRRICNRIEADPSLYSKKIYYKLTNDITVKNGASPLYLSDYIGPNCYRSTSYGLVSFDCQYDRDNSIIETGEEGSNFSDIVERMGPLTVLRDDIDYPPRGFSSNLYIEETFEAYTFDRVEDYAEVLFRGGFENGGSRYDGYSETYRRNFYRSAAFTGVFDGNGYSVTIASGKFLFGYVENGAEIKNLKVKGTSASLAYMIDATCSVHNCAFEMSEDNTLSYIYNSRFEYSENEPLHIEDYYSTNKGVIMINGATVTDSINYKSSVINGKKTGYVDLGNSLNSDTEDLIYDFEECIEAKGAASYFEHLDFDTTWTMIDGTPALKVFCEKGDANFDGAISGKDANVLRSIIATGIEGLSESELIISDINGDGAVNAKDSNLLKQKLSGTN